MTVPLILVACCAALCAIEANAAPATSNADPTLETESLMPFSRSSVEELTKFNDVEEESNELVDETSTSSRTKRYAVSDCRWDRRNLAYRVDWIPEQHNRTLVEEDIAKAFATWANYTVLNFTRKTQGEVDILLKFGEIDGVGKILARTNSSCTRVVTIEFDKEELVWGINGKGNNQFYAAAVHEVGHALGIGHSNISESFMNIYMSNRTYEIGLPPDDISAVQEIYPKVPHLCDDTQVDVLFPLSGHIYVFRGEHYWEVTNDGIVEGYPKLITSRWPGLPSRLDAAILLDDGETLFMKGSEIWRYNMDNLEMNVDDLGFDETYEQIIRGVIPEARADAQRQVEHICLLISDRAVLKSLEDRSSIIFGNNM